MVNNNAKIIYIFAPHPDDETLGCGGTIIKKLAQGYNVKVVVLTDGSHSHTTTHGIWDNPSPQELAIMREAETRAAIQVLGVPDENLTFLKFEDGHLSKSKQLVVDNVKQIFLREQNISEVYITHAKDKHKDHQAANAILRKTLEELELTAIEVFNYVIWGRERKRDLGTKVEIDISAVLEQKIEAIQQYKSQITKMSPEHSRPILEPDFLKIFTTVTVETFWQ